MSDTPELSNVARVLISRMESHPEDFKHGERFGHLEDSLYNLIGLQTSNHYGGAGRLIFLSDADRAALADAWRAVNYTKFEKEIMDALFQSDAEREEERKKYAYSTAGQSALRPGMLAVSTGTIGSQPVTALNQAQNAAGNTGLFGSAGTAIKGFFG